MTPARAVLCAAYCVVFSMTAYCEVARAESITFKVCDGQTLTFRQPKGTDKLQAFCPGKPLPVLTIKGCVGPHVKLVDGFYVVTCDKLVVYPEK
jgi:hypothetical protein